MFWIWVFIFGVCIVGAILGGFLSFFGALFSGTKKQQKEAEPKEISSSDVVQTYDYHPEGRYHQAPDREVRELMKNHDLDQEDAEKVKDIMDSEGLDEDEAIELKDEF